MKSSKSYVNNILVNETIDYGDGTGVYKVYNPDGSVASEQQLTDLPLAIFDALNDVGVVTTLLVVEGVISLQDASNALHEEPAHLEHEALAWSLD
jgi:hypothetical protein